MTNRQLLTIWYIYTKYIIVYTKWGF